MRLQNTNTLTTSTESVTALFLRVPLTKLAVCLTIVAVNMPVTIHAGHIGDLISPTGDLDIIHSPASVRPGALEPRLVAFAEQKGIILASGVRVDAISDGLYNQNSDLGNFTIPAGTRVNSYYLNWDGRGGNRGRNLRGSGSVSFGNNEKIIGVIERDRGLNDTNVFAATNTSYPRFLSDRGFELRFLGRDEFSILNNQTTISVSARARFGVDGLRILTQVIPEPSSAMLALSAFASVGVLRRRRN